ncbi:MAG: M14 family zinc carboxypeptidase [Candidatus Edwardsbacteria bacterium]|nr:M14 family zinc carboxypeptidase [Candidatus Edwardsbacteria bacterium]
MKKILMVGAVALTLFTHQAGAERHIVKVYPGDRAAWQQVLRTEDLDDVGLGRDHLTIITTPEQMARLEKAGCRLEVVEADIASKPRLTPENKGSYHSFAEMQAELEAIAADHPAIAKLDTLGYSWEGRPILCLKISDNVNVNEAEPEVLYMGLHHAREWITVEVVLQLAILLTDNYGLDPDITELVDSRELYLISCVNPDGYVYDYGTSYYWRKNRRNNGDGTFGVDLNRNYDGSQSGEPSGVWGAVPGCSHSTGDATYCGPAPFSEPELQAIRDLCLSHNFAMCIDFHSYSELALWPWGFTNLPTTDGDSLAQLGTDMAELITQQDGSGTYTPMQAIGLYPTTGTSDDWLYGYSRYHRSHSTFSYCIEVGQQFHPAATYIDQICLENRDAALLMAQRAGTAFLMNPPFPPRLTTADTINNGSYTVTWDPPDSSIGIDRYELHELTGLSRFTDDAESGIVRWDTARFKVSAVRSHSPTSSFRADSSDNINATLVSANPIMVQPGDSLTYWRWVSTEAGYDYFYVDISNDGGTNWINLETLDGTSYAAWTRKAFSLAAYSGQQVMLKFMYNTDYMILEGGVYLDDIYPVVRFAVDSTLADTITGQSYNVAGLPIGTYYYKVRAHNPKGWGSWSNLDKVTVTTGVAGRPEAAVGLPQAYHLGQAYPNPAQRSAAISYQLPRETQVVLSVYNIAGQRVRTLVSGSIPAGYHTARWDGRDEVDRQVSSGVYLYRMSTPDYSRTGKLSLIR